MDAMEADEHFAFAVRLLRDANRETNPKFQIARYFACLEALAYKIKSKERPSRKAIAFMIGLDEPNRTSMSDGDDTTSFDDLELARLIRDKLFHGVDVREIDYPGVPSAVWHMLRDYPLQFVQSLRARSEIEVLKWANDASLGRSVAEGRAIAIPVGHAALSA